MTDKQQLETSYQEVTTLYDGADALIATIESSRREDQEAHFQLVNPVVEQLEASTDILTEEFINIAQATSNGKQVPKAGKSRIEAALRMVYSALDSYHKEAGQSRKQAFEQVRNIVDPVIEKIKRQVEKVITIFVGFVDLALDRIMQKADFELLKKREEKIANMLYEMSLAPGKAT